MLSPKFSTTCIRFPRHRGTAECERSVCTPHILALSVTVYTSRTVVPPGQRGRSNTEKEPVFEQADVKTFVSLLFSRRAVMSVDTALIQRSFAQCHPCSLTFLCEVHCLPVARTFVSCVSVKRGCIYLSMTYKSSSAIRNNSCPLAPSSFVLLSRLLLPCLFFCLLVCLFFPLSVFFSFYLSVSLFFILLPSHPHPRAHLSRIFLSPILYLTVSHSSPVCVLCINSTFVTPLRRSLPCRSVLSATASFSASPSKWQVRYWWVHTGCLVHQRCLVCTRSLRKANLWNIDLAWREAKTEKKDRRNIQKSRAHWGDMLVSRAQMLDSSTEEGLFVYLIISNRK